MRSLVVICAWASLVGVVALSASSFESEPAPPLPAMQPLGCALPHLAFCATIPAITRAPSD